MIITDTNPNNYIKSLGEAGNEIRILDAQLSKALPKADRVMWEGKFWGGSEQKIIGYGTYSYVGSNKKEGQWFIVGLAQQKNYITVFVNAANGKEYVTEKYKDKLGKVKVGKSTINFTKLEQVNTDELNNLVAEAYNLMTSRNVQN